MDPSASVNVNTTSRDPHLLQSSSANPPRRISPVLASTAAGAAAASATTSSPSSRQLPRPRLKKATSEQPRMQKSASEPGPSSSELLQWMNAHSRTVDSSPPQRVRTNSDYYGTPSLTSHNKPYGTRQTMPRQGGDYSQLPPRPGHPQRAKSTKAVTRMMVNDEEQAEGQVLRELEDRRRRAMTTDGNIQAEGWSAAVEGEQPPLGRQLPFRSVYNVYHDNNDDDDDDDIEQQGASRNASSSSSGHAAPRRPPRLQDVAFKVRHALKAGLISPRDNPHRKVMLPPQSSSSFSRDDGEHNLNQLHQHHQQQKEHKLQHPQEHQQQQEQQHQQQDHQDNQDTGQETPTRPPFLHSVPPLLPPPPPPPPSSTNSNIATPSQLADIVQSRDAPPFETVLMEHEKRHQRNRSLTTDTDRMVHGVLSIEQVFLDEGLTDDEEDDDEDFDSLTSLSVRTPQKETSEEELLNATTPLLGSGGPPDDPNKNNKINNNTMAETRKMAKSAAAKRRRKAAKQKAWRAKWHRRFRSFLRRIGLANSPTWRGMVHVLLHSFAITVGVPSFLAAIVIFYTLGAISLDFLPGNANLVWWLAFVTRQCVTLDMARISQWFLVDCVALRSRLAVLYCGPLVTLWAIQSHGWPFLFTAWSLINMLFLLGRNQFQLVWLFVFWEPPGLSSAMMDPQGQLLTASEFYFRTLLAMLVAGVATSAKRTSVAMYFGRKTLLNYRGRLEKLLEDMSVIEEVAQLAYEADTVAAEIAAAIAEDDENVEKPYKLMKAKIMKRTISAASDGKWHSMTVSQQRPRIPQLDEEAPESDGSEVEVEVDETLESTPAQPHGEFTMTATTDSQKTTSGLRSDGLRSDEDFSFDMTGSGDFNQDDSDGDDEADYDDDGDDDNEDGPNVRSMHRIRSDGNVERVEGSPGPNNSELPKTFHRRTLTPMASSTASMSMSRFKNLLERWEEPVNKQDRSMDASIHDILKFRKALTYMDEAFPFSAAFGPASTRDECIKSSHRVYRRLLKISSVPGIMSFDVLKVLSLSSDGIEDEAKTRSLRRLFRPDVRGELSLLAFVQSCDMVYKRLRYFRASVGNSSVIDKVLQDIIDVIYFFALSLLVLSMLKFNPWPLLVSISTLMVSCAFAVGTSTSKLVEGILLIAARRPYDLGDRIVINNSEDVQNHGVSFSWIVEDINLFTTTLRYGGTNEVATVSNGSIASARIVNCQRSQNALVTLELQFASDAPDEQMDRYQATIEQYIRDRPRTWDSFGFFRCDSIDTGAQLRTYTLQARHNKTWQDSQQILLSRSALLKFCIETGDKMRVNYEIIHNQINYDGGTWEGPRLKSKNMTGFSHPPEG